MGLRTMEGVSFCDHTHSLILTLDVPFCPFSFTIMLAPCFVSAIKVTSFTYKMYSL